MLVYMRNFFLSEIYYKPSKNAGTNYIHLYRTYSLFINVARVNTYIETNKNTSKVRRGAFSNTRITCSYNMLNFSIFAPDI